MPMAIESAALDRLRRSFAGAVIVPGDSGYDDARSLYNAMIDVRPAVMAQCADVDDVVTALRFGPDAGVAIGVRGGGHGVAA